MVDFEQYITRRGLLKVGVGVAASLSVGCNRLPLPVLRADEAQAAPSDLVIEADIKPWSTPYWFPLAAEVADHYKIPLPYASLRKHDLALASKTGGARGHAEQWQREFDNKFLKRKPRTRPYAGRCHATANGAAWETKPSNTESRLYGQTFNGVDKMALMAIKHQGDEGRGFVKDRLGIEKRLDQFRQNRMPLVGNIPDKIPGMWFRLIYQVIIKPNGEVWVRATNLGDEDKDFPLEKVESVQLPFHNNNRSSRSTEDEMTEWINPRYNEALGDEIINAA